jgi:hypothetical protein
MQIALFQEHIMGHPPCQRARERSQRLSRGRTYTGGAR